jgi:hypothetical protein
MKFENRFKVAESVDNEGLEYFIMNYTRSDSMPDDDTKKAFDALEDAIMKFKTLIGLE